MILSPCRDCSHRKEDKNLCADSCSLLGRVQMHQASSMKPATFGAVDASDEDGYPLTLSFEQQWSSLKGFGL